MLVLTLKSGAVIKIGDDITIRLPKYFPMSIKLAIDAPKELRITREEDGKAA